MSARRRFTSSASSLVYVVALLCAPIAGAAAQQAVGPPERFTAVAKRASLGHEGSESALEIVVSRWTTREESERLGQVLEEGGQEAFVKAARAGPPAGAMHEFLRRPVVARRVHPLTLAIDCAEVGCFEDGRATRQDRRGIVILIAGDDGGLSFIRLDIDRRGRGKGVLVDEAVVVFDARSGTIRVVNTQGRWVPLTQVRAARPAK